MAAGGRTVLVVDDEPSLRLLCRVNLELEGFAVLEAATLQDARDRLDSADVDVVILDVHVGPDDGRDLLDELRAQESGTRVLMLTGSADLTKTRFETADAVMPKPFDPEDLVRMVRELAEGGHRVANGDPVS